MSVQAMTWVIEHADAGGSELLVMLMVANHAHADGTGAYPGEKRLAAETRMSERQVRRLLGQLVAKGALQVEAERSYLKTKVYRIAGMVPDKMSGQSPDIPDALPDIEGITPDKSGRQTGHSRVRQTVRNRQEPSRNLPADSFGSCPSCSGDVLAIAGRRGTFYGCSEYPACSWKGSEPPPIRRGPVVDLNSVENRRLRGEAV